MCQYACNTNARIGALSALQVLCVPLGKRACQVGNTQDLAAAVSAVMEMSLPLTAEGVCLQSTLWPH